MSTYLAFYKPYEVLSQFTDAQGRQTLKDYISIPGVYAAGRLDYRSEGLLLLSDDGVWIHRLTDPRYEHEKTYYAQVEGIVDPAALQPVREGINLKDFHARPAYIEVISDPGLPPRSKPVRNYHPTSWLKIVLKEGKKHEVRKLTAAVGYPTLRLVRVAIGPIQLGILQPGESRLLTKKEKLKL